MMAAARCEHVWDETRQPPRCLRCGEPKPLELGDFPEQWGEAASDPPRDDLAEQRARKLAEKARPFVEAQQFGEHLAKPLEPVGYLVEALGLVGGGGAPHLVAGYGFSGKTIALQSMALSLAAGRSVWGVHLGPAKRVLHVDLEQGERLTRRRYQRLAHSMGLDLAELGDSIAVAVMPKLGLHEQHAAAWKALMAGYDLVMVDSLRAATGGIDENSSEMRGALDLLGQASEATGCHGIVIHHSRKPTEDSKGGRWVIGPKTNRRDIAIYVRAKLTAKERMTAAREVHKLQQAVAAAKRPADEQAERDFGAGG